MPIEATTTTIRRSDNRLIKKHSKLCFIELKKAKTEPMFRAIKSWYNAYKVDRYGNKVELPKVEIFEPKTITEDVDPDEVQNAYGDIYAKYLCDIFKVLAPRFHVELAEIVRDLETLKHYKGKEVLVPLLNIDELKIVGNAIMLNKNSDNKSIKVKEITPRKQIKHEYTVNYRNEPVPISKKNLETLQKAGELHVKRSSVKNESSNSVDLLTMLFGKYSL